MMKQVWIGVCLSLLLCSAAAQEETPATVPDPAAVKVTPILEEWKATLLYGLVEDVIKVLGEIRTAKENALNPELVILFQESLSDALKLEILGFFTEIKYTGLEASALKILNAYAEYPNSLVVKCIKYLAAIGSGELAALGGELLDATVNEISIAMLQALGELQDSSHVELLLKKLADDDFANERKPEIILTLGTVKATAAVDQLIEIVENKEEEKIWRLYACDSLGKIGDQQAVPVLKKLFLEPDALLRAYAASALSCFKLPEVTGILIQGLKDSNWKVRVQAAKGLAGAYALEAVAILQYKVKNDPARDVRFESMRALGAIGSRECFDFLREAYRNEKLSLEEREAALAVLLENDLAQSVAALLTVIQKELNKPPGKAKIVELTAKRVVVIENPALEPVIGLFLSSSNWLLRIYGIRGTVSNRFSALKPRVAELAENDPVDNVKKEALSGLGKW